MKSLTAAQARVLSLLEGGAIAESGNGSAVVVDGKRICNIDTITALVRTGLVKAVNGQQRWAATIHDEHQT